MNPFDLGNLGGLLGGMQQRMADIQARQANTVVDGTAGGGLVTIKMTCDQQVQSVEIGQDAFEDRELLEDLVRAAMNEALRKVKEETAKGMQELTGGLPIPPGLIPGL